MQLYHVILILLSRKRSRVEELIVKVSDDEDHVNSVEHSRDEVNAVVIRNIVALRHHYIASTATDISETLISSGAL